MKTSPWAKLMRRTIPYTIVYPSAIRAYTIPSCSPFSACCRKYSTVSPLWVHHFHEFLLATLDLEDRGALDHVAIPVHRGFSGDRFEVPDRGQGIPDLLRVIAPRLADRLEEHVRSVVRQRSEGVGDLAVLCLVLLHPCHDLRPPVVRGVVVGKITAFDCAPGNLHKIRRIPSVRTDQADIETLLPDLHGDQADLVVVVRQEEDVGARGFHLGQEGRKIDVVLPVRLEGRHFAALFSECVE